MYCVGNEEGVTTRCGAGDAGVCTLRFTLGSESVVSCVFFLVASEKIVANCCSACICSSPTFAKGAAGDGFSSTSMRSVAAAVAASAEDSVGMLHRWGKNSSVRTIRVARVLGIKTW